MNKDEIQQKIIEILKKLRPNWKFDSFLNQSEPRKLINISNKYIDLPNNDRIIDFIRHNKPESIEFSSYFSEYVKSWKFNLLDERFVPEEIVGIKVIPINAENSSYYRVLFVSLRLERIVAEQD